MFFFIRFLVDFVKFCAEAFLSFSYAKCPKRRTLGNTFLDILLQSWESETYGLVGTKPYFSWFLRVGFGNFGSRLPTGLAKWIWGCNFAILYEIQGPTGHRKDHFFSQFLVKIDGRFSDDF